MAMVADEPLPDEPYRPRVLLTSECTTGLVVLILHRPIPRTIMEIVTPGPLVGVNLTIYVLPARPESLTRVALAPVVIPTLSSRRSGVLRLIIDRTTRPSPDVASESNVADTILGAVLDSASRLSVCMWLISAGSTSPLLPVTVVVITVPRNGADSMLFRLTDVSVIPLLDSALGNPVVMDPTGCLDDEALLTATESLQLSPPVRLVTPLRLSPMLSRVNVAPDEHASVLRSATPLLTLPVVVAAPARPAEALGSAQSVLVGTRALALQLLDLSVAVVMTAPNADLGGHSREAVWPTTGSPVRVVSPEQPVAVPPALRAVRVPGLQSGVSVRARTWLAPILTIIVVLLPSLSRRQVSRRSPGPTDALTDVFPPLMLANSDPSRL